MFQDGHRMNLTARVLLLQKAIDVDPTTTSTRGVAMLGDKEVVATIAVRNLEAAKRFYEGKVGLKLADAQEPGTVSYQSGHSTVLVYESEYAGTNKATAATWVVGDEVDQVVRELKAKGVPFEHYDLPGMKREGDVHVASGMRAAWFKDPDGNIHALVSG
jgi:catechol 2,3-dioxygenase-like lactoylglutathione lyase family enzyme